MKKFIAETNQGYAFELTARNKDEAQERAERSLLTDYGVREIQEEGIKITRIQQKES